MLLICNQLHFQALPSLGLLDFLNVKRIHFLFHSLLRDQLLALQFPPNRSDFLLQLGSQIAELLLFMEVFVGLDYLQLFLEDFVLNHGVSLVFQQSFSALDVGELVEEDFVHSLDGFFVLSDGFLLLLHLSNRALLTFSLEFLAANRLLYFLHLHLETLLASQFLEALGEEFLQFLVSLTFL